MVEPEWLLVLRSQITIPHCQFLVGLPDPHRRYMPGTGTLYLYITGGASPERSNR